MQHHISVLITRVRGVWQYRWYAALFSWLFCAAGWVVVGLIPSRYEADARVHIDTLGILRPLLAGLTVQPDRDQQLLMMTRTLISRPNMERLMAAAGLEKAGASPAEREDTVDRLTKNIALKNAGQDNIYTITYADKSPETAKKVVESLLTMLVEGSAGERRRDSGDAHAFLAEHIEAYERRLADSESRLRQFEQRNLGFVGESYPKRLRDVQTALDTARLELREAESARDSLRAQIQGDDMAGPETAEAGLGSDIDDRVRAARRNLETLRLQLTDQHPDVIAAIGALEQVEKQRQQAAARSQGTLRRPPRIELALAEANVASRQARVAEYERRYAGMAATMKPEVEAEFARLSREVAAAKENHNQLLARRESAQISHDIDARSASTEFRIVDPPRVPLAAAWPNRPALVAAVLFGGVAGGVALAILVSQIRPTFTDRRTLRDVTRLVVLGSVSAIRTEEERRKRTRDVFAWGTVYAGLFVVGGAIAVVLLRRGA